MPPFLFLIAPTLSLLLGQVVAGWLEVRFVLWAGLPWAAIFVALFLWHRRVALLLVLCTVAYLWGHVAHENLLHPSLPKEDIAHLPDAPGRVWAEGRLYREPEQRGDRTRWFLRVNRLERADGVMGRASGNVALTVARAYRDWRFGDRVQLPLRLRVPENRTAFDYVSYLARRQIYRTAYLHNDWEVDLLGRESATLWTWVEGLRRRIRRFIYRYLSPPAAPLLEALVLGDRGGLSPELRRSFAEVGMAHVLSISGLHVGMLSLSAFFLFRYLLSRSHTLMLRWPIFKLAALACTFPALLYTALAGGRIPTVRAAIMIGVYQLAVLADRDEETLASLALAALIVAMVWPGAVMEPSFQLSFLAVLAIVWGLRITRSQRTHRERPLVPKGWFRTMGEALLTSAIVPTLATLGTGPLIAYHFGYLSLIGVLVNPLLVPLVGFVLVPLGLFMALVSLVWSPLAVWLAWVIEPLLSLLALVVKGLAGLPLSSVQLPRPEPWVVGCIYLGLLTLACCATSRQRASAWYSPLGR